ncbi:MAG: DUF1287 domain-containing protein, partial [Xanthomonadales bacterium]|nr:DUF1287 domain-containing protein [Xanthomonadales bacterium]
MNKIFLLLLLPFSILAQSSLVDSVKERLNHIVIYDGSYQRIDYPNGDVDANKGVCTDVVIRSYRALGV